MQAGMIAGRCNARTRRSQPGAPVYCVRFPIAGRERCRNHGGATPRGMDNPRWKGRSWSKDIPQRLAQRIERALLDPELSSLAAELALIDARAGELMKRFDTKESGEAWLLIRGAAATIKAALDRLRPALPQDAPVAVSAMDDAQRGLMSLLAAYDAGAADRALWSELLDVVEHRRRLADTERKREESMDASMTAKQTGALIGAITLILVEEIKDEEVKRKIGARMRAILMATGRGAPRHSLAEGPQDGQRQIGPPNMQSQSS